MAAEFLSLREALDRFVPDGCHLTLGGFTASRNPMAAVQEIIRLGRKHLHLSLPSLGPAFDLLVGAGCVDSAEFAYAGTGRFAPTCPCVRRAIESGALAFEDYSNYQMVLRFLAAAMGAPFMPVRSVPDTDIVKKWGLSRKQRKEDPRLPRRKLSLMKNPFSPGKPSETITLVPALRPDTAIIHVQKADSQGTARIDGLTFADVEQAKASRHLIVTCEEIVTPEELRQEPERNHLPFFLVNAVVHAPFGAHPTACYKRYDYDCSHLHLLREAGATDVAFEAYIRKYILEIGSFEAYLERVGKEALEKLRAHRDLGFAPGLRRG